MHKREMDRLVAEKIMTWTDVRARADFGLKGYPPGSDQMQPVPYYSTEIAAAWLVVEKMHDELDCIVELSYLPPPYRKCNQHNCTIRGGKLIYKRPDCLTHAMADTAPMAICLAALRALGVDVQI